MTYQEPDTQMDPRRNLAAEISRWSGLTGVGLIVLYWFVRSLSVEVHVDGAFPIVSMISLVPVCGLVATGAGIVGLVKARTMDVGAAHSVVGLVLGLILLLLSAAAVLVIWAIAHANFDI